MTDLVERLRDQVAREVPNPHSLAAASLAEIERLRAEVANLRGDDKSIWSLHSMANQIEKWKSRAEKAEAALNMIAGKNWSNPSIDSEASNTYAHIVAEMRRIACEALAQKEPRNDQA